MPLHRQLCQRGTQLHDAGLQRVVRSDHQDVELAIHQSAHAPSRIISRQEPGGVCSGQKGHDRAGRVGPLHGHRHE